MSEVESVVAEFQSQLAAALEEVERLHAALDQAQVRSGWLADHDTPPVPQQRQGQGLLTD
jgi:hypothetical protein